MPAELCFFPFLALLIILCVIFEDSGPRLIYFKVTYLSFCGYCLFSILKFIIQIIHSFIDAYGISALFLASPFCLFNNLVEVYSIILMPNLSYCAVIFDKYSYLHKAKY